MDGRNEQDQQKDKLLLGASVFDKHEIQNSQAQRAAAEAIAISRSTLEATLEQAEQLEHADDLRRRHNYLVDKSARLIRGMTWSGWFANKFSKDVEPPTYKYGSKNSVGNLGPREVEERITESSIDVSKVLQGESGEIVSPQLLQVSGLIQNFKCNVLLLKQCETDEELNACRDVCKSLHLGAKKALMQAIFAQTDHNDQTHIDNEEKRKVQHMQKELEDAETLQFDILCDLEEKKDQRKPEPRYAPVQEPRQSTNVIKATTIHSPRARTNGFDSFFSKQSYSKPSLLSAYNKQEKHLDSLAQNMEELLHNGAAISSSIIQQNNLLDVLNDGTDDLVEQTRMITRRANSASHNMMWKKAKAKFRCWVAIQHVETSMYLTIEPHNNNRLTLHSEFHPDASVFGVNEKEESNFIGFISKCTHTWLGQSFFGSVVFSSKRFGKREEWELDDGAMERTKILNVGANSGAGGWLEVDVSSSNFSIGGYDVAAKANASLWSIVVLQSDDNPK